jgi:3-oxosteroid 1-dehydrogenase
MTDWDMSVDLLIAGSGGGGMVAALAALDSGIEPLVVEKLALIGGATGMSGGMVWLPNNPLMRAEGIPDSHEDGLAYFDDVVGDIGEASSPARREMFLTAGYEMIDFLTRKGVRLVRCPGYSDYYPNHKGGNAAGRSVEGIPYDAAPLGDWSDKLQRMDKNWNRGFVVKTSELVIVQYFNRSPRAFAVAMRVFLRTRAARHPDQRCVTHRSDAEEPDRSARRATHLDEYGNGRPDRRGRPRRRRAGYPRRRNAQHRGAQGSAARSGRLQPQRRNAPSVQRRPAQ